MKHIFSISAPGRADFLNTHQDYKGLSVVSVAIDLRTSLHARLVKKRRFKIRSLDLEKYEEESTDSFSIAENEVLKRDFFGNYFRGVVNVLMKEGYGKKLQGMDITVKSEVPIGAGLASSAALEVAFAGAINHASKLGLTRRQLAEYAYKAETEEVGVPCGRLDQYGVSFGGVINLECNPPYHVENLPYTNLMFAIIDSGIRRTIKDVHSKRQSEINHGLKILMEDSTIPSRLKAKLGVKFNEPKWEVITTDEIEDYLSILPEGISNRIMFTLKMQELTDFALKLLRYEKVEQEEIIRSIGNHAYNSLPRDPTGEYAVNILGRVMDAQHLLLNELYDVSIPEVEVLHTAALDAGAYGAKISGAGMGGSLIALIRNEEVGRRVIQNCISAGAKHGYLSKVGEGVTLTPHKHH